MLGGIQTLKEFDPTSNQPEQLVNWLREQDSPTLEDLRVPQALGGAEVTGCNILSWNGRRASLICYIAADGSGVEHPFHLVVMDGEGFDGIGEVPARIHTEDGWSTAVWRRGSKICLLATDNAETGELRRQSERLLAWSRESATADFAASGIPKEKIIGSE